MSDHNNSQNPLNMSKGRLEAFSDGVIAIIITIMVLELKVPHGSEFSDLTSLWPVIFSYVLSFIYVGIYWTNHHHLFQIVNHVNGRVLWANIHFLFWLSLTPFVTAWSGENHFAPIPVALYGSILFFTSVAYYILVRTLIASHTEDSKLSKAIGGDTKGKISTALYAVGIALACWQPFLAMAIYVLVAIIWIVPDRRVEKVIVQD
jgi:uncharacterized membrane protein